MIVKNPISKPKTYNCYHYQVYKLQMALCIEKISYLKLSQNQSNQ